MTTASDKEPTLADISQDLKELKADVERFNTELSQTQKWNDRTWDVIKWVGGISAGLAISAAIALVGIVLRDALAR
jgi:hypothetical protein